MGTPGAGRGEERIVACPELENNEHALMGGRGEEDGEGGDLEPTWGYGGGINLKRGLTRLFREETEKMSD